MLLWLANRFGVYSFTVREPEMLPWEGIYHPQFPAGIELQSYIKKNCLSDRLTVGILFYRTHWLSGNTLYFDALIESLEKQRANVIPVFLHTICDEELGTKGLQ
jgi:cobaltochelatase CobN